MNSKIKISSCIKELIDKQKLDNFENELKEFHNADIAEELCKLDIKYIIVSLRLINAKFASDIFVNFRKDLQEKLIENLNSKWIIEIFENMESDDAVDLINDLPDFISKKIIDNLNTEKKEQFKKLMKHVDTSAGGLMTLDFVTLNYKMTIEEAISFLKVKYNKLNKKNPIVYYVTKDNGILVGFVELHDLLFANKKNYIKDIMSKDLLITYPEEDQESVGLKMQKYDLTSLPVVNKTKKIIGVILVDDIIDIMSEEATEDIYKLSGINDKGTDNYFTTSIWKMIFSRSINLFLILLLSMVAQFLIIYLLNKGFNHIKFNSLNYIVVLLMIPLVIVVSNIIGIANNQVFIRILRGQTINQIKKNDYFKIVKKELLIYLFINAVILLLNIVRMYIFYYAYYKNNIGTKNYFYIVIITSMAISICNLLCLFLSFSLPFLIKLLKFDSAIISGPLLITSLNILSTIIMFYISYGLIYKLGVF